jgi:hypothetical protein
MRTTLHGPAPNTYYGHWLAKNAGKHAAKRRAIAHNELVASAGIRPLGVTERDFPGNRSPARWKFVCRPKVKSARQATGASSDDHSVRGRTGNSAQRVPVESAQLVERSHVGS